MKLIELLAGTQVVNISGQADLDISGITYSSSQVEPENVFVAIKGLKTDGHDFLPQAIKQGAAAIISERQKPEGLAGITWVQVVDAREALALASAAFYDHPALKLKTVGITGTKGKTTVSYILESILQAAGLNPGVIGTIEYRWNNQRVPAARTTPEAPDIQKILKQMAESQVTHCLLEVSSHSLELKRVLGIGFDLAIFTNLSGEHLDYHQTMENYFEAKKKLFFLNHKRQASIVNIDDQWGQKLITELPMRTITFGFSPEALIRAENFAIEGDEMKAQVSYPGSQLNFKTKLIGRHNLYNFLAAISAALAFSVSPQAIIKGISQLHSIPGRLEFVPNSLGFRVIVDYAHTDNALENLLQTVKSLEPARIILIFGCGGDRDRSKRSRMGEVAARLADWTIITSDNPRSEEPEKIIEDIEQGFLKDGSRNYEKMADRQPAIKKALTMAAPGDFVVIAGKGHETYQIFKDRTLPFSDFETASEIIKKMEEKK
ncbi:MAG: UDP-N-acetylmuramoyl-L-alanyl-D-glutamate--2,6-diaminopimelate ligase [Acidobacteriota bacterium]|nr:UDP-N-acetylmuramoyl-L-alanyl-D-glutamate--2,6-diaminopimelate ligase [Acidobacteriota bacterium]